VILEVSFQLGEMGKKAASDVSGRTGLTKGDLADLVYDLHGGLTKTEAVEVVNTILGTVKTSLLAGRKVKIQNFGVFEVTRRKGRSGVSPVDGQSIFIPSHKGLSFRPSKKLRHAMEGSQREDS
jgi:nucleoid DNA-binding protein